MNPLSIKNLTSDLYARADDGTILPSGRGAGIFSVELTRRTGTVRVPILYYFGYTAEYTSMDNTTVPLPVSREKETQVAEIDSSSVEPGGTITVEYKETRLQRLSFYTSLVAAVLFILYPLFSFLKKRRRSRTEIPDGK